MELIQGKEYQFEYHGKTVKGVYCSKGGSSATGYDTHAFKLNRRQKFNIHGDNAPLTTMKYAFIDDDKLKLV